MLFKAGITLGLLCAVQAAPAPQSRNRGGGRNRQGGGGGNAQQAQTAQQQAQQIPEGISTATDGSQILDMTMQVNGEAVRVKVSAPADQFVTGIGVDGATQQAGTTGTMPMNVLLHGDGGQSFFDLPNQAATQTGVIGVAMLAPNENLFWGGGQGLNRVDGVAHAQIVNDVVTQMMPQMVAFDPNAVSFTGVSGGSLMLSGFFVPAHMGNFTPAANAAAPAADDAAADTADGAAADDAAKRKFKRQAQAQAQGQVLLNCGALEPQVQVADANAIANTRIHFQSTQQELADLQTSIPAAVTAYEQVATDAGLSADQVGALQTVDNSPNGGHCEFDEQDFVSGVQLMADSFAAIMNAGGDGQLAGTNVNVLNPVVGNENLQFQAPARQRKL